jgi:hypothetical protein
MKSDRYPVSTLSKPVTFRFALPSPLKRKIIISQLSGCSCQFVSRNLVAGIGAI